MDKSETKYKDFRKRLDLLIGNEKPYTWANRVGIPSATFVRILNEGSIPRGEHLASIAEKTNASIDWLLTGRGEMYYKHPSIEGSEIYLKSQPSILDTDLLTKVIAWIEKSLRSRKVDLPPSKKSELIVFLYSDFLRTGVEQSELEAKADNIVKLFAS